jgi:hypothetical protein
MKAKNDDSNPTLSRAGRGGGSVSRAYGMHFGQDTRQAN